MIPDHYIGSDLSQTIEFQDENGTTIPAASIDSVKVFVMVNNVVKTTFTTETPAPTGWEELTEDDDVYTYTVEGSEQTEWTPGLIEVEVYRKLTADDAELVSRQQVFMARRSASQTNAFTA